MKAGKRFGWAIASLFIFALVAGCSQGPWEEFSGDVGNFTVQFPGTPKVTEKTESIGNGIDMTTTSYEVAPKYGIFGGRYTVAVSVFNIPSELEAQGFELDEKAAREGGKQGIQKEGGKVTAEGPVDITGHDGWEYEITAKNTDSTIRMFINGYTMYTLEVARRPGKDLDEESETFFDSFTLSGDLSDEDLDIDWDD